MKATKHCVVLLKLFLNNFCSMAGYNILLKETTSIREYYKVVYVVCNNVLEQF